MQVAAGAHDGRPRATRSGPVDPVAFGRRAAAGDEETIVERARPLEVLFVNEGIGGHATLHRHLQVALADHPEVRGRFVEADKPTLVRKVAAKAIPGLASLDADLAALR